MYEIEIFEVEGGFGYRVGGVYQEFHPNKEGLVPMTQEEAETLAAEVLQRLTAE